MQRWPARQKFLHDQPGITRDRLPAICTRGERPFTLWDTGGIFGAGESELTQQVRHAAENALRESDLLLFVVDGKEGVSPVDKELVRMLRKSRKPVVLVINKIDTAKHDPLAAEFDSLGFDKIISISAEHAIGRLHRLDAAFQIVVSAEGPAVFAVERLLSVQLPPLSELVRPLVLQIRDHDFRADICDSPLARFRRGMER